MWTQRRWDDLLEAYLEIRRRRGNKNVTKTIGLTKKNNHSSHAAAFFFVHFITITARLRGENA